MFIKNEFICTIDSKSICNTSIHENSYNLEKYMVRYPAINTTVVNNNGGVYRLWNYIPVSILNTSKCIIDIDLYDDEDASFDIEYYTEKESRINIVLGGFVRSCVHIHEQDLDW